LPDVLLTFLRAEVIDAIQQQAGDAVKDRKLFLSIGKTGTVTFGPEYAQKKKLDAELKAALRKADNK